MEDAALGASDALRLLRRPRLSSVKPTRLPPGLPSRFTAVKLGFPLRRDGCLRLPLAAVERFGVQRLHEVVNQEQEQAPQ